MFDRQRKRRRLQHENVLQEDCVIDVYFLYIACIKINAHEMSNLCERCFKF